jgi:hypothetical protein
MPNIAIGDAPRSCAFTLLQVAMLAFVHRSESIYTKEARGNILSAGFGALLIGLVRRPGNHRYSRGLRNRKSVRRVDAG